MKIRKNDPVALRENFEAISEGRAVVVDSPGLKRRGLKVNEILSTDTARLTKHFEQIRNGLMIVVTPDSLPFEDAAQ